MTTKTTLPGRFSIVRTSLEEFTIEVIDDSSRTHVAKITVSASDLMLALSGKAEMDCTYEINDTYAGQVSESKIEDVTFSHKQKYTFQLAKEALKPFEVDGWTGNVGDLNNMHRRTATGYSVIFHRFIRPEAKVE